MRPTYMVASIEATETRIGKARRYQRRAPDAPFSLGQLRERELFKAINRLFGASLPDDDCGREALRELLNQLALNGVGPDQLREFALDFVPELDDDDSIYNLVKEVGTGRKRRGDTVARALGITYEMRTLDDLRTIGACDMSSAQRNAVAAQKRAADKRWEREKSGAKPQAESEARTKPWEAMGIGRTKYYALKKAAAAATPNGAGELLRHSYSSLSSSPKQFAQEAEAPVEPRPDSESDAPAEPPSPSPCRTPSFVQPEPESDVSELRASCAAKMVEKNIATTLREAHRERNQLLKLGPLDAERVRRLTELGSIIETARYELEQRQAQREKSDDER